MSSESDVRTARELHAAYVSERKARLRAEQTNTRLRDALRLATYAFAQYAEERNDPSDEAVEGFMDGFMQDADLRRLASDAEQEPEGREGIVTVYDHHNRYLGCMGIERWRELLALDAEQENA